MVLLDEVETQVEALRRKALELSREQEQLERTLGTLGGDDLPKELCLSEADREDVSAHVSRLSRRLSGVEVRVHTRRDPAQEEALAQVEGRMAQLVSALERRDPGAKAVLGTFLASAREERGRAAPVPVDPKFEGLLLSCSSEDQKKVRARLERIRSCANAMEEAEAEGSKK